jgi:antitoxin HicB
MFTYPVRLEPDDNDTVLLTFPDIPGAVTFGDDEADALARGVDALETMIIGLMEHKDDIPVASRPKPGQKTVTLPALSAAKVSLYQAMRQSGVRKSELGRRLGWHMMQVDRLLDLRHASRFDQIETALRALGKEIVIEVREFA